MTFLKMHWRKLIIMMLAAVVPMLTSLGMSSEIIAAAASIVTLISGFMKSMMNSAEIAPPTLPPQA